jgi:hypothetical protein
VAFPTLPVIKDFNYGGGDGGLTTKDAHFSTGLGASTAHVVSQTVNNSTTAYVGNILTTPATYGPDTEVYIDVVDVGDYFGVFARLVDGGTASYDGYSASWNGTNIRGIRWDNGAATQVGATGTATKDVGDALGLECIGSAIKVYTREGGTWTQQVSATDSTYTAAGPIGFDMFISGSTIGLDNLGGGTIAAAGATSLPHRSRRAYAGLRMRG